MALTDGTFLLLLAWSSLARGILTIRRSEDAVQPLKLPRRYLPTLPPKSAETRGYEYVQKGEVKPIFEVEDEVHLPGRKGPPGSLILDFGKEGWIDQSHGSGPKESPKKPYSSGDVLTAISTLDHFFKSLSKHESYNSELHPPPNPILSLILSRYGRYVPGTRTPGLYSYMATNNIHNNKPFGQYKYEREADPLYDP